MRIDERSMVLTLRGRTELMPQDPRQVSLAWLHQRLGERGRPVSVTALSYWRSGRSQPERGTSRDAVEEIQAGNLDVRAGLDQLDPAVRIGLAGLALDDGGEAGLELVDGRVPGDPRPGQPFGVVGIFISYVDARSAIAPSFGTESAANNCAPP